MNETNIPTDGENDLQTLLARLNEAPIDQLAWKMIEGVVLAVAAHETSQDTMAQESIERVAVIFSVMTSKLGGKSFCIEREPKSEATE